METKFEELVGKTLTLQKDVTAHDTYDDLLSTAALTKLMLDTAWKLLDREVHEGVTSVAAMVLVSHEEPTVAGETVTVTATVDSVRENRVEISFEASDETGVIAHGRNERLIVDRESLKKLGEERAAVLKTII